MKINLVLLDDTVDGYLTWKNLQLNHLLHVVTLKGTNSFIQLSWMNLFLTHFNVNAKAILCNSERRCEKRNWWIFSCLFDVYLFSRLVHNVSLMQLLTKFSIILPIQSNIVTLKDMQNASGQYIFTFSVCHSSFAVSCIMQAIILAIADSLAIGGLSGLT